MTLEELDKLEKEVKEGFGITHKNLLDFFGDDPDGLKTRIESIDLATEIFLNSLRMINEERAKINLTR